LRPIYLGEDLFACQPIVTMLTDAGLVLDLPARPAAGGNFGDVVFADR
jgi:hypothetical protein